ncbi:MAG: hypothetical protein GX813_00060 [Erysipelotrichia bacterium]|nr:hypothetical protein [Erysipelotrichia bacterium]
MKKSLREVEALAQLIIEYALVYKNIANLPCGYISVKQISGHTYCYRQWREGEKIVSQYVPKALLSSVKRQIAARKNNEAMLKEVKKDLKKVTRKVVKSGLLTEGEIIEIIEAALQGADVHAEIEKLLEN